MPTNTRADPSLPAPEDAADPANAADATDATNTTDAAPAPVGTSTKCYTPANSHPTNKNGAATPKNSSTEKDRRKTARADGVVH